LNLSLREVLASATEVDAVDRTTEHQLDQAQWQIDLLGDPEPAVRLRAAAELGRRRAVDAAPALVERLGLERDFFIRETLTWAILRIGDNALPYLHQALWSPRWLARRQAAHVISKRGRQEDGALLLPLIMDEVDAVASRAYAAAGQIHDPSLVPALVGQLSRGDAEHRNALTAALVQFGGAAVPALVEALRSDPRAEARRHAADTLALVGSPDADRAALALAEALGDPDRQVRMAALNAVGQLRSPFATLVVNRAAQSPEPALRHLAVRLRGRQTVPAAPAEPDHPGRGAAMTITTADVKRLRERTGAGVMRCKAALEEAGGDHGKAALLLRSATAAARRPDRAPPEGMIAAGPGTLIELTCETDFVAKSATFRALGQQIADLAAARPEADVTGLLSVVLDGGTLADALADLSSASGEKIEVGRVARLPGRTDVYLHTTALGLPPRIGALVAFEGGPGADEIAHRVALQVTASAPRYLARGDIPDDVLATVRRQAEELARAGGKPAALVPRIVAGRVEHFIHEVALLEQVSIVDPGRTVDDLLYGTGVRITGFVRLQVGSGVC
jgi:elongation factor Ts